MDKNNRYVPIAILSMIKSYIYNSNLNNIELLCFKYNLYGYIKKWEDVYIEDLKVEIMRDYSIVFKSEVYVIIDVIKNYIKKLNNFVMKK